MATGQVLFQRFFYTKSFVKHSMEVRLPPHVSSPQKRADRKPGFVVLPVAQRKEYWPWQL